MQFIFLGTGDVRQVPVFGCRCLACTRAQQQPELRRGPTSALIRHDGQTTLLDAGQCHLERLFAPGELNRIVLTHFHMDHVQGLFGLRWGMGEKIPVFCPPDEQGCDDLYRHPGLLAFQPFVTPFVALCFGTITLTPLPLTHSKITYGYLIEESGRSLAYLTDTVGLPDDTLHFLLRRRPDHLVLDCSYAPATHPLPNHNAISQAIPSPDHNNVAPASPPPNHNDISLALGLHRRISPGRTWLTHIGHEVVNWLDDNQLPDGVAAAYDGQQLEI